MNSTIVKGKVFHERFLPVSHRFSYPVRMYCLDLSELETMDRTVPGFSYNRRGIASIHDRDYLDPGDGSIKDKLFALLEKTGDVPGISRVMLVTSPGLVFSVFNPVSFYYCFTSLGEVACVVAEVNNTFGDRHLYILNPSVQADKSVGEYTVAKTFHVSPFNSIEGEYKFHIGPLDQGVDIRITMRVRGEKKFFASLQGEHLSMAGKNHLYTRLRDPFLPHLTMSRILRQAALLYFRKKLPYIPRPIPPDRMTILVRHPSVFQKISMSIFLRVMKKLNHGHLTVILPDNSCLESGDPDSREHAVLEVRDYEFFSRVILREDIGFGEAYMSGLFHSPDLAALIGVMVRGLNRSSRPRLLPALVSGTIARLVRFKEHNSLSGSKKNISRHYDLSNSFFKLFLDESMTYSSALFSCSGETLEQAQENKIQSIIEKGRIKPGDHVLEIGSGWGSFAVAAVRTSGCRVTTITLSREQHRYVNELVRDLGLEDRITPLLQDYRTLTGRFDKIVSIEMLEAVGHRYLGTFFRRCHELMEPEGRVVLQVITIPDQRYSAYRLRLDWIQKHIFPGGHLPSLSSMCNAMRKNSPLVVDQLENIGPHYAETLRQWHLRFSDNLEQVRALGYDEVFLRKWEFYLKCCEAMFRERALQDLQMVLVRPFGKGQFQSD